MLKQEIDSRTIGRRVFQSIGSWKKAVGNFMRVVGKTAMKIRTSAIVCALFFSFATHVAEADAFVPSELDNTGLSASLPDSTRDLLKFAQRYEGTPYRSSGSEPKTGFDCSGFVRYVFDQTVGVTLPHGSNAISQIGSRIELASLLPGDLVFFRILHHAISHVGIYLGNDQFIHASSTRTGSVMVSNLTENYWAKHFTLARRLAVPVRKTSNRSENAAAFLDGRLQDYTNR